MNAETAADQEDPSDLNRFLDAQQPCYDTALAELRRGRKESHWMWFIFPQLRGLGFSAASQHYGIRGAEEARRYLKHPVLGARLQQCAEALLGVDGRSASEIMGYPDDLKLQSSMTLFAAVAGDPESVFAKVLRKYYDGEQDETTRTLLKRTAHVDR